MTEGGSMKIRIAVILAASLVQALCASGQNEQKLARAREKDPQYQYNLGLFHLNSGNVDEALKTLQKSLSLDPRNPLAWNAIGLARSMKGDLESSAEAYRKSLEIDSAFSEAHNNLGAVYQELGLLDRAQAEFEKVLLDEKYATRELPYYNLARLHFLQDKLEPAFENVQRALQIKPRFGMALNLKGLILEKRGDVQGAVDAYDLAVKAVPDDLTFSFNLAVACFKNGQTAKSREIFERLTGRASDLETKDKINEYLRLLKEKD